MIIILVLVISAVSLYMVIDYRGPKKILLQKARIFSLTCQRAGELIAQEYDSEGNLWASRGMILYRLQKGDNKFMRMAHVPTGFSFYWLSNFSLFRKFINKPECVEATITGEGHICALSAGFMWHRNSEGNKFVKTLKLRHYGFGTGRGILSNGLLSVNGNHLYFGEYFRNSERSDVLIYLSKDNGRSWDIAHKFDPGIIRHIHALQKDPYTGLLWFCTGDEDSEAMIGWSDNGFRSINIIGKGKKSWRTEQLVFTEEAVYWGADTGSIDLAGIYRWDKLSEKTTKLYKSDGAILYGTRLAGGSMVFSTDREGFPNEKDKKTSLIVVDPDHKIRKLEMGTWKHQKRNFRFSFAMLRMQRNQGNYPLTISVINQKEFSAGDMLIFQEANISESLEKDHNADAGS